MTLSGGIDAQTAAWVSAFCTGMMPAVATHPGLPTGGAGTDLRTTMIDEFQKLADAFSNTSKALAPLPPPTFTNGTQFASDVVKDLSAAAPVLSGAVSKLKGIAPTDQAGLEAELQDAGAKMEAAVGSLQKYDMDANMQKALGAVPACAAYAKAATAGATG